MGYIIGSVSSPGPLVLNSIRDKVQIRTTIELKPQECNIFATALVAVEKQYCQDYPDKPFPDLVIAFLDGHVIHYDMDDDCYGSHVCFALYNIPKIRDGGFPDEKLLIIFLEELCHAIWRIHDEIEVKIKVTSVFNSLYKTNLAIEELFNKDWLVQNGYECELKENSEKRS